MAAAAFLLLRGVRRSFRVLGAESVTPPGLCTLSSSKHIRGEPASWVLLDGYGLRVVQVTYQRTIKSFVVDSGSGDSLGPDWGLALACLFRGRCGREQDTKAGGRGNQRRQRRRPPLICLELNGVSLSGGSLVARDPYPYPSSPPRFCTSFASGRQRSRLVQIGRKTLPPTYQCFLFKIPQGECESIGTPEWVPTPCLKRRRRDFRG